MEENNELKSDVLTTFSKTLEPNTVPQKTFHVLMETKGTLMEFSELNIKQYVIQRLDERFNEFAKDNPGYVLVRVDDPTDKRKTLVGLIARKNQEKINAIIENI